MFLLRGDLLGGHVAGGPRTVTGPAAGHTGELDRAGLPVSLGRRGEKKYTSSAQRRTIARVWTFPQESRDSQVRQPPEPEFRFRQDSERTGRHCVARTVGERADGPLLYRFDRSAPGHDHGVETAPTTRSGRARRGQDLQPGDELQAIGFTVVDVSFGTRHRSGVARLSAESADLVRLSEEAVDRLRASGAEVLRDSPAFRKFAEGLREQR